MSTLWSLLRSLMHNYDDGMRYKIKRKDTRKRVGRKKSRKRKIFTLKH